MKKNKKNFFLCSWLFVGDMKFFIENQKVEKEVAWVKNQVRLHMNGATTSQMESRGIHYRENFGVAVPHLKQLAKRIPVSYALAERLWFLEIRETMLLAALIVPSKEMTLERCKEWTALIDNKDLVERSAMFLWSRVEVLDQLLPEWLTGSDVYLRSLGLFSIGRRLQGGIATKGFTVQELIGIISMDAHQLVYQAGSYALRMCMRHDRSTIELVRLFVTQLRSTNKLLETSVAEELQAEIDFLGEPTD
ncbi:DNA alkylation repair protein [Carboxylicivirga taeanensis]|uniref:DNA alkylation repair protein n=1 Tax=Carboxylicivirga taeanensis TaxID=1416875 RepID=UPI003F6DEFAD